MYSISNPKNVTSEVNIIDSRFIFKNIKFLVKTSYSLTPPSDEGVLFILVT